MVLLKHGGLYTDVDTECKQPMDQLVLPRDSLIVGLEQDFPSWEAAYRRVSPPFPRANIPSVRCSLAGRGDGSNRSDGCAGGTTRGSGNCSSGPSSLRQGTRRCERSATGSSRLHGENSRGIDISMPLGRRTSASLRFEMGRAERFFLAKCPLSGTRSVLQRLLLGMGRMAVVPRGRTLARWSARGPGFGPMYCSVGSSSTRCGTQRPASRDSPSRHSFAGTSLALSRARFLVFFPPLNLTARPQVVGSDPAPLGLWIDAGGQGRNPRGPPYHLDQAFVPGLLEGKRRGAQTWTRTGCRHCAVVQRGRAAGWPALYHRAPLLPSACQLVGCAPVTSPPWAWRAPWLGACTHRQNPIALADGQPQPKVRWARQGRPPSQVQAPLQPGPAAGQAGEREREREGEGEGGREGRETGAAFRRRCRIDTRSLLHAHTASVPPSLLQADLSVFPVNVPQWYPPFEFVARLKDHGELRYGARVSYEVRTSPCPSSASASSCPSAPPLPLLPIPPLPLLLPSALQCSHCWAGGRQRPLATADPLWPPPAPSLTARPLCFAGVDIRAVPAGRQGLAAALRRRGPVRRPLWPQHRQVAAALPGHRRGRGSPVAGGRLSRTHGAAPLDTICSS